jgi:hypothetical protein
MSEDRPNVLESGLHRLRRTVGSTGASTRSATSQLGEKAVKLGSNKLLVTVVVAVLLFGFTPISHLLMRSVNGSFAPTTYSSLALDPPSDATLAVKVGSTVRVTLANHTERTKTYRWTATQGGSLISLGTETLQSDGSAVIRVPTRGALAGLLKITLADSQVFITVPLKDS